MNPSDDMQQDWRDSLEGHESPLDVEGFWADLEPRLPKKRRRRGLLWWWLGGIGAAGVLLALWLVPPQAITGEKVEELQLTSYAMERQQEGSDREAVKGTGPSHGREMTLENGIERKAPETQVQERKVQAVRTEASARKANPRQGHSMPARPAEPMESVTRHGESQSERGMPVAEETAARELPPASASPPGNEDSVEHELLPQDFAVPEPDGTSAPDAAPAEAMPELKKKRKRAEWALDILGGPGISVRSMMTDDDLGSAHLALREATERPLESWSAGADLRWTAKNGLFVAGGFRWLRINERFDWRQEERRSEYGLADGFLLTADGAMVPWQDSAWITWQETRTVIHYNTVETVEVPLALGYRFPLKSLTAEGALGGSWNIRQWADGRSLDRTGLPADWNGAEELRWRRAHGLGLFARCRLGWSPFQGTFVFLQPEVRWSSGNRMDAAAGYRVRYTQAFLQAGVSLRLK